MARTKQPHRSYSPTQKIGAMALAVTEGVSHASEVAGVPEATLYTWFENDAEGLRAVRKFVSVGVADSIARARKAISQEIIRRIEKLEGPELAETFRAMMKHEAEADVPRGQAQGQDQKQLTAVTVNVHRDGSDPDA